MSATRLPVRFPKLTTGAGRPAGAAPGLGDGLGDGEGVGDGVGEAVVSGTLLGPAAGAAATPHPASKAQDSRATTVRGARTRLL
ncbi:hypothetical protein Lfu02_52510 [Longispora fulva]|nr:hypothetical protein Lfu02_52510 [Longispora fulva]